MQNEIPEFDQLTQYVIMENGVPVVKDMEQVDEQVIEPHHESAPFAPYEPEPSLEERVAQTESKVVTIKETIGILFGGVE